MYGSAQTSEIRENLNFHRFTSEQGLSNDVIHCLLQDKKGFLWIGTSNGLCRYDGNRFMNFFNDPSDTTSVSSNEILSLALDPAGNIWAGTFWKGLNKFDQARRRFIRYNNSDKNRHLLASNTIHAIRSLDENRLVIAQGQLVLLDQHKKTSSFISLPENTWSEKKVSNISQVFAPYNIFIDSRNKWWLTGESGILRYDPATQQMDLLCERKEFTELFSNNSTWTATEDKQGNIWIGSGAGLFEFSERENKLVMHYPTRFKKEDAKSIWVKTILCSSDGQVWFGTGNGLFRYDPLSGNYTVFHNDPSRISSLSSNDIHALLEDRQHIIWIGTNNGLNALYPSRSLFDVYRSSPGDLFSLESNNTKAAFRDEEGNIWIGTGTALECVEPSGRVFQYRYFDRRLKNPPDYQVMPLLKNDDHTCWIGTWGAGLQLFDYKKRKFIASYVLQSMEQGSIASNFIHSLCRDNEGNLWIATWNGGIDRFNPSTKIFEHYNSNFPEHGMMNDYINKINFVQGKIWAGSPSGLFLFDKNANRFQQVHLPGIEKDKTRSSVTDIIPGEDGGIWVSSWRGLYKKNATDQLFTWIRETGETSIVAMTSDRNNKLWLATNAGLKRYDPVTGQVLQFSLKDGLPVNNFPVECYFSESPTGEIFLGTHAGLVHFNPGKITRNNIPPSIHITGIKVDNKDVPGMGDPASLESIKLTYNQNNLSISLAAMNFIHPAQNQFAYKLEGFDQEWIYSDNRNEAIYTNLPPGQYTFQAKASNDAGLWNETPVRMNITILTPWWKSWWFYLAAGLTVIAAIGALYRIRINRLVREQKLRNRIASDLHDDIGSTLSGIKLFSGIAEEKLKEEQSEALAMVQRINQRSDVMIEAMSDIVWSINPRNDSVENMLVKMKQYAAEMLEPKNIHYEFISEEKVLKAKLGLDIRRDVYLIYKEAINNASKHSGSTAVMIELRYKPGCFFMKIEDNGVGMDDQKKMVGNGMANFKIRAARIRGSLEINSERNKGTTVLLEVPVT